MRIHTHTNIYTYSICVCVCVCACIHTHTHTYIYIYKGKTLVPGNRKVEVPFLMGCATISLASWFLTLWETVSNQLCNDAVSHPRRMETSATWVEKPQNTSKKVFLLFFPLYINPILFLIVNFHHLVLAWGFINAKRTHAQKKMTQ